MKRRCPNKGDGSNLGAMPKRRVLVAGLALFALLGCASPAVDRAAAGFDEGVAAWVRGDYATALSEFRVLAAQGDAGAQASLGFMYGHGQGVPQNHAEAEKWYRKAAEQGDSIGQANLGLMYLSGLAAR